MNSMPSHYQQSSEYRAPEDHYRDHSNRPSKPSSSTRGMTPEQYQARRGATPQRDRSRASSVQRRPPPPGKFASQRQTVQEAQTYAQRQPSPSPRRQGNSVPQHQQYSRMPPPPPPDPNNGRGPSRQRQRRSTQTSNQHARSSHSNIMNDHSKNKRNSQRSVATESRQQDNPTASQLYHLQLQQELKQQEEQQRQAVEREEEYNVQFIQEREEDIKDINKKVNQVNEIYSDLAGLIDGQQDLIEKIDVNIEDSHAHTKAGFDNYEEARLRLENPIMDDMFGDKLNADTKRRPKPRSRNAKNYGRKSASYDFDDGFDCVTPFESISEDFIDVVNDVKTFGSKMFIACTQPEHDDRHYNEYASDY